MLNISISWGGEAKKNNARNICTYQKKVVPLQTISKKE